MLQNHHDNNAFLTNRSLCFPYTEKRPHLTVQNILSKFLITNVILPENHFTCWSSSGYLGVKQPIVAYFVNIFSSPEKIVARSLFQCHTMDLVSTYSGVIFELFVLLTRLADVLFASE